MNQEINDYVRSKKGRRQMNTVLTAYITFMTEEGHDEVQNYIKEPEKYVRKRNKAKSLVNIIKGNPRTFLSFDHLELLGDRMEFTPA